MNIEEYMAIMRKARAEYEAIKNKAFEEYDAKMGKARSEYDALQLQAYNEYNAIVEKAEAEYKSTGRKISKSGRRVAKTETPCAEYDVKIETLS